MALFKKYRQYMFVLASITSFVIVFAQCMNNKTTEPVTASGFEQFAGSDKCISCHKDIVEQHRNSNHYLTSRPAVLPFLKGDFEEGKNTYRYNPELYMAMQKRDSGYYQVVYYRNEEKKAMRFDMIFGSGNKGQSYAWRSGNNLFQMPITYYAVPDKWSNSPGFPERVQFDRPITSRCLECHSTYAEVLPAATPQRYEAYDHAKMIYGVDCEKCHGPAVLHVEYQTAHPAEKIAKYIVNPKQFSRQQQLDLCALCHGGRLNKTQPAFSYTAGKDLADYFKIDSLNSSAVNLQNVDAHGNQYGLLRASKCFRMSDMTCNTCHGPHENERGKIEILSAKCMACHNQEHNNFCKNQSLDATVLKTNCIDCHMPTNRSKAIVITTEGDEVPKAALFRSHYITVYPDATKKYLENLGKATGSRQ